MGIKKSKVLRGQFSFQPKEVKFSKPDFISVNQHI